MPLTPVLVRVYDFSRCLTTPSTTSLLDMSGLYAAESLSKLLSGMNNGQMISPSTRNDLRHSLVPGALLFSTGPRFSRTVCTPDRARSMAHGTFLVLPCAQGMAAASRHLFLHGISLRDSRTYSMNRSCMAFGGPG